VKKLYRSRSDRWVAGVAGGLGEYLGIDPTLIRLLWIVLLLPGGVPGLVPYIICWIVIPQEPETATLPAAPPPAALPVGSDPSAGATARDA
jgi:phage shock protein PspC (stress-responsive transcriptional regulator)